MFNGLSKNKFRQSVFVSKYSAVFQNVNFIFNSITTLYQDQHKISFYVMFLKMIPDIHLIEDM